MVPIMSLWMPILLSAVIVFIASSIIHMFLSYHNSDFMKAPDEDKLMDALRGFNLSPGEYLVPKAEGMKEMRTPEFMAKMEKGPGVKMTIWPGSRGSMTQPLIMWFLYSVVVGVFAAYIAGRALGPGASYLSVFRFAGCTAFACYVVAQWQDMIWFKAGMRRTIVHTIDGLLYGLLTAGTFGWLWPAM